MTLEELRAYRRGLAAEESRVSYWRRLLQARIDVLAAGGEVVAQALPPLLAAEQVGTLRNALLSVVPAPGIPPLPDLVRLWQMPQPADPARRVGLLAALERATAELSAYRRALHQRLDAATDELIARYREDPTLCLSALPVPRAPVGSRLPLPPR